MQFYLLSLEPSEENELKQLKSLGAYYAEEVFLLHIKYIFYTLYFHLFFWKLLGPVWKGEKSNCSPQTKN